MQYQKGEEEISPYRLKISEKWRTMKPRIPYWKPQEISLSLCFTVTDLTMEISAGYDMRTLMVPPVRSSFNGRRLCGKEKNPPSSMPPYSLLW